MAKKLQTEQPTTALVLRCCAPDMSSKNGFVWPGVGEEAIAPDWKKTASCGAGLHGWLYGQGDHSCSDYWNEKGAKWLVVEVELSSVVMLGGKVKFPRGTVRFVGEKHEAAAYLIEHEPQTKSVAVIGASVTVGDEQAAQVGALGTATAGYSGTATAGYYGTATAGNSGTATAGDSGTATAGDYGTATAGDSGTATAGNSGTATAGYYGELRIRWYDSKADRYRTAIAYVGEGGIEPNVAYRLDDKHEFVRA
jgi:hypothetical protein